MDRKELVLLISAAIIAPVLVACGVSLPGLGVINDTSQWIGFWGGYAGSIFGGLVTLFVLQKTMKNNQDTLEKTLVVEKEREAAARKQAYFDDICEQMLRFSAEIAAGSHQLTEESQKNILVSFSMIDARLKSRRDDADYAGCEEMILAFNDFWRDVCGNLLVAKNMNDEDTAWDVIAFRIAQAAGTFNEKVIEFYVLNIR